LEESILSGEDYTQNDVEFHTQIGCCSKNIVMPALLPVIHDALTLFADMTEIRNGAKTIKAHRQIVDAIRNTRSWDAQNAKLSHLMYNQDRILKVFETKKTP
jgi:GntR family transcriptional repressor for pyruvate dehydrogenase complex